MSESQRAEIRMASNLTRSSRRKSSVYLGVFLISSSALMMELILTRIFSVKLYYHYAFMVISLALLGSGASGVYVYLFPRFFRRERLDKHLYLFSLGFAASIPIVLWLVLQLDFQLSFEPSMILRVFLLYSVPAVPFFLGGMCLSLAMTHFAQDVSRIYFLDLTGAGFGCLLVIPLLAWLGGPSAMLSLSCVGSLACFFFALSLPGKARLIPLAVLLFVVGILVFEARNSFLTIKHVKGRNEGPTLFSKWNSFSRITVVQVDQDPKNTWIIMDGDAGTQMPNFHGDLQAWGYLRDTISSLAYHLKPDAETLIIGPGGGIDVLTSLVFGNKQVTGVEINPITVNDVMRGAFRTFTGGLYDLPQVHCVVDEGRSFIRRENRQYDVIQATLVDTWAATAAGAFVLTENNLYTVEAFKDYLSKLRDDGILTITRWNLDPPQQDLRLVAITRAAMTELQMSNPERSMMVVRKNRDREAVECNFLFKKSGFSDADVNRVEAVTRQNGFEILYTPHTVPDNPFAQLITTADPQAFYERYPFNVAPTYDNSPFFFHTLRVKDLWNSHFLSWESKKTNVGVLVLFLVFLSALTLVLLFILVPLFLSQRGTSACERAHPSKLGYFICLGLGFILVEMTLVQKFILFLGQPVYALSIVLFSMLVFSGLGSFSSRLFTSRLNRNISFACLLIALLILIYVGLLPAILYKYVSLPTPHKALIVIVLLFPLSFWMGIPMPLGIHRLQIRSAAMVPWAWGVNGSASVLGSVATVLIATNFGFNQALFAAATFYALGACLISSKD
jgi:predicted membrane-bound spermidine synthase